MRCLTWKQMGPSMRARVKAGLCAVLGCWNVSAVGSLCCDGPCFPAWVS